MQKYKKISNNIEKVIIDNPITSKKNLVWINIKNAGKKEIEYLRKKFNFDFLYLQASSAKARSQRPIVRSGKDYLFVILHFPVYKNGVIESEEIEFFLKKGSLVTLHNDGLSTLKTFFNLCKKDGETLLSFQLESSAILMYEILDALLTNCFNLLDDNTIMMKEVEEIIFSENQKMATSKILHLRRNIINFRRIMQNHKNIMKKLVELEKSIIPAEKLKTHYTNLINRTKRVWEMLENQKEMIEALHDTNESMLNYKISDIMKTLTVFSVIVFPLTLFAAIFGMNTIDSMPFVENEHGFWIILSLMLIACFGMLLFFKKKKWL